MEIIRNCHLITMDRANTSYENGAIVIEGGKIIDVGDEFSVTAKYKDAETIDAGGGIVVPGFIDTHTHSAMTLFRGMADDLPLMDWLNNHIFPAESKFVNREFVRDGALIAAAEMIHSGITTFLDMYFFQNEAAKVFKRAGMRAFLSEGLINFPTPDMKSPIDAFDYVSNFIENWLNDDLISPAVAAHAPYTCSDELLVKSRELADKYNIVFNIHLSETENEVETILKEKGKRPTHYLNELGILKKKTVLAHCVHINEEEAQLIKASGASVAHNPQSNMKLASGIAPINMFRSMGINVTIGTDGVCSNNNLDILEEGREAALLSKVNEKDPTVLDDEYILRCLTINGAKALGIEDKTGSLEIGKEADIVIIATDSAHMIPLHNPYSQLVYSANQSDVRDVMIKGKWIMRNGKILSFDEGELKEVGKKWQNRIKN